MVNIRTPENTNNNITVSSPNTNNAVNTLNSVVFSEDLAQQWAVKLDGKVKNEDYSSKYYALQAKQTAEALELDAKTINELKPQLLKDFENYGASLASTKEYAIEQISVATESSVSEITLVAGTAIQEVQASTIPVLQEIETVTTVANNIDVVTDIGENLDNILNKTVKVGKTTTGEAGTQASVVNAGTNLNPVLDFTIPKGERGLNGGMTATYENETLNLHSETGTMLNPKWGNIAGDISSQADLQNALNNKANKSEITNFATKTELNTKQPKGNYALVDDVPTLVSELENDSNYATQTQVLQAIASIPQFKLSIVNELPLTGEKMTLYFVPKEGADNDIYNEYVWIEQTSSYEFLGSTAVDLTDYVKKTDYANSSTGGVVRVQNGSHGLMVSSYGILTIYKATEAQIKGKNSDHAPLVTKNIDLAVKTGVTTNTIELTDDEKTSACNWLGTVKTVSLTQADYDALATKDANTLYLIEE